MLSYHLLPLITTVYDPILGEDDKDTLGKQNTERKPLKT
jgi:hypothetical protein